MTDSNPKKPITKDSQALHQLVGAVVVAGAAYAAKKIISSRKNKKASVMKAQTK